MLVHALISSIRTRPEPTVFTLLNCLDEEFADLVCGGLLVPLFRQYYSIQFCLVPIIHRLGLLLDFILLPRVLIQILLCRLPLHI